MRVTTSMLFDAGKRAMMDRQADLFRTQEQLSTGRRVLRPSDDPIAAAEGALAREFATLDVARLRQRARDDERAAEERKVP